MRRSRIAYLILFLILAMLLAACGGGDDEDEPEATEEAAPTEEVVPTEEEAAPTEEEVAPTEEETGDEDVPAGEMETTTFDVEGITVSYPAGWFAEDKGGYISIDSGEFVSFVMGMDSGEVSIQIDQSVVAASATPAEHVVEFMTPMVDMHELTLGEVTEITVGDADAARLETEREGEYYLLAVAIDRGDGEFIQVHAYTNPDEFEQYEPLLMEIINSIVYTAP